MNENRSSNGVFWIIDGELYAFPFERGKYTEGLAKSQTTYAHKKLWQSVRAKGCRKPYNYYPRGRVHVAQNGDIHLYLNPHITEEYISELKRKFCLSDAFILHYEYAEHYKCYLDEGWLPDE